MHVFLWFKLSDLTIMPSTGLTHVATSSFYVSSCDLSCVSIGLGRVLRNYKSLRDLPDILAQIL